MDDAFALGYSVRAEAKGLCALLRNGHTAADVLELIAVPEREERALRAYARVEQSEAAWIESILKFRSRVAREFERLAGEAGKEETMAAPKPGG